MIGSTVRSSTTTDKPKKPFDMARALLTVAAVRNDHLIAALKLPVAAARQVVRSLLNAGFAEEVPVPINHPGYAWRTGEDGGVLALRATALGIARALEGDEDSVAGCSAETIEVQAGDSALIATPSAVDPLADATGTQRVEEGQGDPDQGVTVPATALSAEASEAASKPVRPAKRTDKLRRAAQALLGAWDSRGDTRDDGVPDLTGAIAALRATLAASASAHQPVERASPRPGSKQAQVLTMLARDEGASGPQIAEAMDWAPHTVRGFLAGLGKTG
jgi:hypothetical protein